MLLAFDVGNTTIAIGLFRGRKLVKSWKIKTDSDKTSDEYGAILLNLMQVAGLAPGKVTGGHHLERRPAPDARHRGGLPDLFRDRGQRRRAGAQDGHAHPLREPPRGRRRPDHGRGRRLREVRRPAHRPRFRHGDDLRRRLGQGRIPGRGHRPRHPDLGRGPLPQDGPAAPDRDPQAEEGHRPDDRVQHAVRASTSATSAWSRRRSKRSARSSAGTPGSSPRAASAARSRPSSRRSRPTSPTSSSRA